MSKRLKLILILMFSIQIGLVSSSYYSNYKEKAVQKAIYEKYSENPLEVKVLDLRGLKIKKLISEITQFQNLESLNLADNSFDEFPSIIYQLPKLRELNLSGNQLEKLHFLEDRTLEKLNLRNNKIYSSRSIDLLKNLKWIDLSNNKLFDFPYFFTYDLDTILITNNKLNSFENIKASLNDISHIKYLDISSNQFQSDDDYFALAEIAKKCEALNISNNYYEYFPYEIFTYNESLDWSDEKKDMFVTSDFDETNTQTLHTLDMSNSTFSRGEVILQKSDLKNLNLSGLNLLFTVEMFQNFPWLETLYLENSIFGNFNFKHETLKSLYINGLRFGNDFNLDTPKLEFLAIRYNTVHLLSNSNLPQIKTISIYDYPKEDMETIKTLKRLFPNVEIEFQHIGT